jgi:RNA polymerase-binding transcription factor
MKDPRNRLEKDLADVSAKLRQLGITPDEDEQASRPDSQSVNDIGDVAQVTERRDFEFGTRERLARRIERLTAALRRVEDGSYGTCERCGERIAPARLEAIPEASMCRDCQEEMERLGAANRPA